MMVNKLAIGLCGLGSAAIFAALFVGCADNPRGKSTADAGSATAATQPKSSSLETEKSTSAEPEKSTAAVAPPRKTIDKPPATPIEPAPPVTENAPPKVEAPPAKTTEPAAPKTPAAAASTGEELFAGWPRPKVAILISGEQNGYIEPCGCAGKGNQKGGLSRRYTLVSQLRAKGWPLTALDLGGQVNRFGRQAEIKFDKVVRALGTMGYQAVGLGPADLRLSAGAIIGARDPAAATPFISANVSINGDATAVERFRIIEVPDSGMKIGVTAILGDKYRQRVLNDDLKIEPAAEALTRVAGELKGKCDFQVLLAHATPEESTALAEKFPQFQVVVTAGGADEPPAETARVNQGKTHVVEVGHKAMHVAVLGIYPGEATPVRYQRVALTAAFADSPEMKDVMTAYQQELEALGWDELGVKPLAHPTGREFVGSSACGDCHTKAFAVWSKTPHARALATLEKADPPRHFDAECISCHVIGWEPQQYYPFRGGFVSREKTPELADNGCENCHGPGSAHVAAESGLEDVTEALKKERRGQMRVPLAEAEKGCVKCHDHDNSPAFHAEGAWEKYWKQVEHKGMD